MRNQSGNKERHRPAPERKSEVRRDLQDGLKGRDLCYLNEMPQMSGYEGLKAGVLPPKPGDEKAQTMADES